MVAGFQTALEPTTNPLKRLQFWVMWVILEQGYPAFRVWSWEEKRVKPAFRLPCHRRPPPQISSVWLGRVHGKEMQSKPQAYQLTLMSFQTRKTSVNYWKTSQICMGKFSAFTQNSSSHGFQLKLLDFTQKSVNITKMFKFKLVGFWFCDKYSIFELPSFNNSFFSKSDLHCDKFTKQAVPNGT